MAQSPADEASKQAQTIREIRINPIVPTQSVLVATARGMRPKKAEAQAPRDTRKHVDTCPDRKSTRLNSSHTDIPRMPSSA